MNLSMRRLFGVALAGVFVCAATAANADVVVTGTVDKTKTRTVDETITITKTIQLTVEKEILVDAAAEQDIIKNQRLENNFVEDENAISRTEILDFAGAAANGVIMINQASGFENNQGNEVSITYAMSPPNVVDELGTFSHAEVSISQFNDGNEYPTVFGSLNSDTIGNAGTAVGPFASGAGIVDINQAAGHMNNQNNAQAIALGDSTVFALGEIDLGQFNTLNVVDVIDNVRTDTIAGGAFIGFNGIAKVNQAAGSMNNQANVLDVAADIGVPASPFPPGP